MKCSGIMRLIIILKVTKIQDFTLFLEDTFLEKPQGGVNIFKVQVGKKIKNNKLMSFGINDEKLLEKYKAISAKMEDLKNIELNALPVYDDRYIQTKKLYMEIKFVLNFLV